MGIRLCNQLIVRDVLVIRENYKAVDHDLSSVDNNRGQINRVSGAPYS